MMCSTWRVANMAVRKSRLKVVGIDPAPKKGATIYDPASIADGVVFRENRRNLYCCYCRAQYGVQIRSRARMVGGRSAAQDWPGESARPNSHYVEAQQAQSF